VLSYRESRNGLDRRTGYNTQLSAKAKGGLQEIALPG
jgi:hypothetical protein